MGPEKRMMPTFRNGVDRQDGCKRHVGYMEIPTQAIGVVQPVQAYVEVEECIAPRSRKPVSVCRT
jgi:hypothetical protein